MPRYQGFEVNDYVFTLDALPLRPPRFCDKRTLGDALGDVRQFISSYSHIYLLLPSGIPWTPKDIPPMDGGVQCAFIIAAVKSHNDPKDKISREWF
jgi:hypothetical protein